MIVVSNATVLIGLAKIGKLDLLPRIFSKVYIPEEVFKELVPERSKKPGSWEIEKAEWVERKSVTGQTEVRLLMASLDQGEAEVLVLGKEMKADLILLDEEKARKAAAIAGFEVMGLVGLLILAKNLGLIEQVGPYIEELRRKNFRISEKIVLEGLKKAGEVD